MVGATFLGNMWYVPCVVLCAHLVGPLLQAKPANGPHIVQAPSPYSLRSIASLTLVKGSLCGDPEAMRWEQGVCFTIFHILFSYCFRQSLCFRSDTHCFDCWRLVRDFTVTASLTVYNGNFNAIRHEGSKVARNCMDASAIFIINTRNLNPNFSGCRNRIFDFDIPALDLTSFEWTYVLPYARINFPFILPSICLKDMGKTKLIREATCEGHISCCLRVLTIRKRGMYSQYSRRNLGSIICLASPHVRASVMDHGQEGRVCVITL